MPSQHTQPAQKLLRRITFILIINDETYNKNKDDERVDAQLNDASRPLRLTHAEFHLGKEYAPYACNYADVYKRAEGEWMAVYLAHDLPEELHDDKHEHKVAYDMRDGMLRKIEKIAHSLKHQQTGHNDNTTRHHEEDNIIHRV